MFWVLNVNALSISCNLQPFSAGLEASLITVGIQKVSHGKSHRKMRDVRELCWRMIAI